jgi:DNA-directed RNA polymerase subunit RPC12/RpoP/GTPase SAR1 family protein
MFNNFLTRNDFTCPYCFNKYDKAMVKYVCPDCGQQTIPQSSDKGKPSIKCETCGKMATVRLCPKCGNFNKKFPGATTGVIPAGVLDADGSLPLCIIGITSSGKTNYITVMLHELRHMRDIRIASSPQDASTRETYSKHHDEIYVNHVVPEGTNPLREGETLKPQLWEMKNLMRKHGSTVPTYNFTIYDGAGENHQKDLVPSSTICSYISASKGIIITLDPLILDSLRNKIDPDVRRNSGGSRFDSDTASDVVNDLATYIKQALSIDTGRVLDVPVAIVLTKFDTVLSLDSIPRNAIIRNPSMTIRDGRVNMEEIKQVDQEIKDWLEYIGEDMFINAIESHFSNYRFFGVSSYGAPPANEGKTASEIHPHRVLDPVLWLFKQEGFID